MTFPRFLYYIVALAHVHLHHTLTMCVGTDGRHTLTHSQPIQRSHHHHHPSTGISNPGSANEALCVQRMLPGDKATQEAVSKPALCPSVASTLPPGACLCLYAAHYVRPLVPLPGAALPPLLPNPDQILTLSYQLGLPSLCPSNAL